MELGSVDGGTYLLLERASRLEVVEAGRVWLNDESGRELDCFVEDVNVDREDTALVSCACVLRVPEIGLVLKLCVFEVVESWLVERLDCGLINSFKGM